MICECELATRADIEHAIIDGQAKTLDDIRRDVRLGMGPCQGGFCTFRAAGILHQLSTIGNQSSTTKSTVIKSQINKSSIFDINTSIRDFLQERWKGLLPILWGQQLRQESLNELICLNVLNIDHLPGPTSSRLGSENYMEGISGALAAESRRISTHTHLHPSLHASHATDTLIIGAGLAGLTAAWQLSAHGQKVRIVSKGWGATHWASGCIDLLGYYPISNTSPINSPVSAIARLAMEQPNHPYAQVNMKQIEKALKAFQGLCAEAGYPLKGSLAK